MADWRSEGEDYYDDGAAPPMRSLPHAQGRQRPNNVMPSATLFAELQDVRNSH
jgi:hypothetical protein